MSTKSQIRKEILAKRTLLSCDELKSRSKTICQFLAIYCQENQVHQVFGYQAFREEVDLTKFFEGLTEIALPVVVDKEKMEFHRWRSGEQLSESNLGIMEPEAKDLCIPNEQVLILVPSVAVDKNGVRLGYGGGFYDRYFTKYKHGLKIGVCLSEFVLDQLPSEEHDTLLDGYCSDHGVVVFNR